MAGYRSTAGAVIRTNVGHDPQYPRRPDWTTELQGWLIPTAGDAVKDNDSTTILQACHSTTVPFATLSLPMSPSRHKILQFNSLWREHTDGRNHACTHPTCLPPTFGVPGSLEVHMPRSADDPSYPGEPSLVGGRKTMKFRGTGYAVTRLFTQEPAQR